MKRFLLLSALALAAFVSCKTENKLAEPGVFKVTPRSANAESGFAHALSVNVTCDVDFKYSLKDGSWITIEAGAKNAKNVTELSLNLAANDGDAVRSDILTLQAGSQKLTVEIGQKTMASALPSSQISLKYVFPTTLALNFPQDWTLSSKDSWVAFEPSEGAAGANVRVAVKATELNLAESSRSSELTISFDGSSIAVPVIQESSLPTGAFAEKAYGLYNFGGLGGNVVYDPLKHQTNLVKRSEESLFRLVWPSNGKMVEIGGLPLAYEPSGQVHLVIYQNWNESVAFWTEKDAWVLKAEDSYAWLIDSDLCGYVVKK
ncbi:MAG: hypothetical protein K6F58_04300 [Bacteroidales bacterium]|nr:hypothetical protein [Bacteroidales bacterium]